MSAASPARPRPDMLEGGLRAAAVALAIGEAYIHSQLGGLLFTLNAIGYATLAVALVLPIGIVVPGRFAEPLRLLVRLGLMGFAAATLGGWLAFGARFDLGYEAAAAEVAILIVMALDIERAAGGPVDVVRHLLTLAPAPVRRFAGA